MSKLTFTLPALVRMVARVQLLSATQPHQHLCSMVTQQSGNDPHPEACESPLSHNVLSDCFQHVMFPAVEHPLQQSAVSYHNQRPPIATAHICVFSHPASMRYQNLQYIRQPLQPICFPHPMHHCQHSNLSLSYSAPGCCPTDSLSGTSHLGSYFLSQLCIGSLQHLD